MVSQIFYFEQEALNEGDEIKSKASRRKLKYHIRRNPKRNVDSLYSSDPGDYYDGPLTRSMGSKRGKELMVGLKDEQNVRRIVYSSPKRV